MKLRFGAHRPFADYSLNSPPPIIFCHPDFGSFARRAVCCTKSGSSPS